MIDLRQLDLNLLFTLDVLFDELSVSNAARRLGVSQPTVSVGLARARGLFGDKLFVRTRSGIRPTPFALKLHPPIRKLLEIVQHELLQPLSFDPLDTERRFSIAGSDVGALASLPPILEALRARAPNTTLRWLSAPDNRLRDVMEEGRIDLALGYFPDLASSGLSRERLFMHPFACMVRKGHPIIDGTLTLDQFLAVDHLEVSRDDIGLGPLEKMIVSLGHRRRVLLHTQEFLAVPDLIASSDMISIVPLALALACRKRSDIQVLCPPIELPAMEVDLFWHRRVQNDPSISWLRELVIGLFKDHDPATDSFPAFFSPLSM